MKRKIKALLILIFAVGALSAGVDYMDSNDIKVGELLRGLLGTSGSLVASGEVDETEDPEDSSEGTEATEPEEAEAENSVRAEAEGGEAESVADMEAEDGGTEGRNGEEPEGAGFQDEAGGEAVEGREEEVPPQENEASDTGNAAERSGGTKNADLLEAADSDESGHVIENFEIIYQMPELPTGCEIVAMTMVLHYYGFDVDKTVMASEYLPTAAADFYYGSDGLKYGPDLNKYFVGDPFSSGYICGTEAILTAANSYLQDEGSSLEAVDLTGTAVEELYRLVSQDVPVLVWVTIGMVARYATAGWYTEEGEYVEWSSNDHGAVLIGYTDDTVTIADPISGLVEYSREDFESVFASRGNQCVVLRG